MRYNRVLLAGASFAALIVSAPSAFAQSEQSVATETGQSTDPNETKDVTDIVVTATLRSERLQDVPIAVSAFDEDSLRKSGVRDVRGLTNVSSSFFIESSSTESGATTLRLRGVGTTGNNTGLESSVGIFLDGVYLSRPGVALGDLLDVEQVEVLRGPQGTLFGRNTSAGALQVRTRKPNLTRVDGFAEASYGNFNLYNMQAGISVPLAEALAVRISGAWRQRDGFVTSVVGNDSYNRDRYIVRGQLYYEPNDVFSVRLIGDYSRQNESCCAAVIVNESSYVNGPYAIAGLPADGGVLASGRGALARLRSTSDAESRDRSKQWGVSAEVNIDLGGPNLTSITSYRHYLAEPTVEADYVALKVFSLSDNGSTATNDSGHEFTRINTFAQELRIAGSLGTSFDYLVGGYYANEDIRQLNSTTLGSDYQAYLSAPFTSLGVPGPNPLRNIFAGGVDATGSYARNLFTQKGTNWAVFTNNTLRLSDVFSVNAGVRYSNDRKDGAFNQLAASNAACAAVNARAPLLPSDLVPLSGLAVALTCLFNATPVGAYALAPVEFDRTFRDEELVYTAKLLAKLSENVNTYVSFSHGYKAGGFNLDPTAAIAGADPRFRSERVNAYEFGIKSQTADRKLTANLAVFHQDLTDFQVLEFTGLQFITFNVDKAKTTGAELELAARPDRNLLVSASVSYTNARYPADCVRAGAAAQVALLCGQSFTNAPKWVVVNSLDWGRDVGNGLRLQLNGSLRFESDRRTSTQALIAVAPGTGTQGPTKNLIQDRVAIQDANVKVNLRAGLGSVDEKWRVEAWVLNVFDVQTVGVTSNVPLRGISSLPGPFNAGGIGLARLAFPQEPRTYGVTVRTRF